MTGTRSAGEVAMSVIYSCFCVDTKLAVQFDKFDQFHTEMLHVCESACEIVRPRLHVCLLSIVQW